MPINKKKLRVIILLARIIMVEDVDFNKHSKCKSFYELEAHVLTTPSINYTTLLENKEAKRYFS